MTAIAQVFTCMYVVACVRGCDWRSGMRLRGDSLEAGVLMGLVAGTTR